MEFGIIVVKLEFPTLFTGWRMIRRVCERKRKIPCKTTESIGFSKLDYLDVKTVGFNFELPKRTREIWRAKWKTFLFKTNQKL